MNLIRLIISFVFLILNISFIVFATHEEQIYLLTIKAFDKKGNPLNNATIEIFAVESCCFELIKDGKTNKNGIVSFHLFEGNYTIRIFNPDDNNLLNAQEILLKEDKTLTIFTNYIAKSTEQKNIYAPLGIIIIVLALGSILFIFKKYKR